MKTLLALCVPALVFAGCATTPDNQVAQADCKIAPITTTSPTGQVGHVTELQRREAEMELGRTGFRQRELQRRGMVDNNVEEALRDCARQ